MRDVIRSVHHSSIIDCRPCHAGDTDKGDVRPSRPLFLSLSNRLPSPHAYSLHIVVDFQSIPGPRPRSGQPGSTGGTAAVMLTHQFWLDSSLRRHHPHLVVLPRPPPSSWSASSPLAVWPLHHGAVVLSPVVVVVVALALLVPSRWSSSPPLQYPHPGPYPPSPRPRPRRFRHSTLVALTIVLTVAVSTSPASLALYPPYHGAGSPRNASCRCCLPTRRF